MKLLNKITYFLFILIFAASCETDEDVLYSLDYVQAPSNVSASFDISQDNTGRVQIYPEAEGATKFMVTFGDTENEEPTEYGVNEEINHNYGEGAFTVEITAIGITGLTANFEQEITVSYRAPENLLVTIEEDELDPRNISVSATADFATVMNIYFGEIQNDRPVIVLPGEVATNTYDEPGDYIIRVVAKSAGSASNEFSDTITISEASDPLTLPITFESPTINYEFEDFGNVSSELVNNPDPSGINTSDWVAQSTKPTNAESWGGTFLTLGSPIDFSINKIFKVKVWSPKSGAQVKLKVENLTDENIASEIDAFTTVSDEWEELSFDFSSINTQNDYQKVVIFFDFDNPGDDATYYFDDIRLTSGDLPETMSIEDFEGTAPSFTVFGNIADIQLIPNPDQSGVNTTATVAQLTKSDGSETWAGAYFELESPLDLDNYSKIKVKTWSPKSGIVVKVKLENQDVSVEYEVDAVNTSENSWEELVYDFSGAPQADYVRLVIFFDFGNPGDDTVYYFDEYELTN